MTYLIAFVAGAAAALIARELLAARSGCRHAYLDLVCLFCGEPAPALPTPRDWTKPYRREDVR